MGILQARILEWVAISSSRGSSWPRDWTRVFCIGRRYPWATGCKWAWVLGTGGALWSESKNRSSTGVRFFTVQGLGRMGPLVAISCLCRRLCNIKCLPGFLWHPPGVRPSRLFLLSKSPCWFPSGPSALSTLTYLLSVYLLIVCSPTRLLNQVFCG